MKAAQIIKHNWRLALGKESYYILVSLGRCRSNMRIVELMKSRLRGEKRSVGHFKCISGKELNVKAAYANQCHIDEAAKYSKVITM